MLAVRRDGADSDRAKRYRRVGTDLVMSIQPKGSPAFRKKFLMQLPPLMKDLNEGMKLIGWPEPAQKEFFGKLLPAHAESLKGQPLSELDHNLLVKQLEAIFAMPVPLVESFARSEPLPEVAPEVIERRFTPEEAKQVGLVNESAVDWSDDAGHRAPPRPSTSTSRGDIQPPVPASPSVLAKLDPEAVEQLGPTTSESGEPGEPTRGPQLIDHIKLGFAYQMHLKDEWQKVQLAHVSSGRSFFVFTRGGRHQETISMTSRMLARMCETGRFRAVESAYLMERATRARAGSSWPSSARRRSTERRAAAQRARHAHGGGEARRVGAAGAGDVERGAVVRAGADERQAERDVDAVLDAEVLHRDQAVVVGHRDDDVELARHARARCARA